jgi:hypothetical protein
MIRSTLLVVVFLCRITVVAQKKAFEISALSRYDKHGDYVTNFNGRMQNDTIQVYGFSYGVNFFYNQKISKKINLFGGVGYYKLCTDKINTTKHPFVGISHTRPVNYDDGTRFLHTTSKYFYHSLSFTIGVESILPKQKKGF